MRRLLALVTAIVLVDMMFYAAITPLLPQYADDLDLSKSAAGVLAGSYAAGTLLGSLPGGWLASRLGVKPTVLAGQALLAVSSLTFGLAQDVAVLDAARFLQGVGGACSWAGALAWLMDAAPRDRRGELIGQALGAAILGALLGPALGAAAREVGTEPVFGAVALAAGGLAVWAHATPAPAPSGRREGSGLRDALRRPAALAGMWLIALPALLFGAMSVLGPLRLDDLGAGALTIGAVFVVGGLLEAFVSARLGRMSDRRGRLPPVRLGLAASAAVVVLLPWPSSVGLMVVLLVLAAAAFGTLWSPSMAMLSDEAERAGLHQALAFALVNLAWAAGQVTGSAAGAAVAEASSDRVTYLALGALTAASLLVTVGRREPAPAAA